MIATFDYTNNLFGGILRTTMELPELHVATAPEREDWTLRVRDLPVPQKTFNWCEDETFWGFLSVDYLRMATTIAGGTRIFALHLARDMDRLGEVAETVMRWHRG